MDDARSATELIADDLATYYDESLVKVFMEGFQEFLDSPARVRLCCNKILYCCSLLHMVTPAACAD